MTAVEQAKIEETLATEEALLREQEVYRGQMVDLTRMAGVKVIT